MTISGYVWGIVSGELLPVTHGALVPKLRTNTLCLLLTADHNRDLYLMPTRHFHLVKQTPSVDTAD